MDYTTGKYYFSAWYEPDEFSKVYSVDINNPIEIVDENINLPLELSLESYEQGQLNGILYDDPSIPGISYIYNYPNITQVGNIYCEFNEGYGSGAAWNRQADLVNNMIWNLRIDRLEGRSLIGETNRDIYFSTFLQLGYPEDERPHAYMRIFDGKAIVNLVSDNGQITKDNWYLLSEDTSPLAPITIYFSSNGTFVYFDFLFSDESEISIDWGDGTPVESHATRLAHNYPNTETKTIALTSYGFRDNIISIASSNCGFINTFPSFEAFSSLESWQIYNNNFTGEIPNFGNSHKLVTFDCHNNNLDGSFLSFIRCNFIEYLNCSNNNFSGLFYTLPDYPSRSPIREINASNNNFTGINGSYPYYRASSLTMLNFENNSFPQNRIDDLLYSLERSIYYLGARAVCTVNLQGSGMASPSANGYTYKNILINDHGWTVLTN
jgi:hypothetical protein